jgi:RNA polymerase sigma-70 factor (ECF subfamily)
MVLSRRRSPPRNATTPDEDLVALAQRGDRDAFAALYDRYLPRVHSYCYRMLGAREAAEDATTDVFMRALVALPACRARSFRAWLFGIAHHVIVDDWRRRRLTVSLETVGDLPDPFSVEEAAVAVADWSRVVHVLALLSEDQQHVIALHLSGLSAVEIGEALGKPRNAIDGIQHRALLRLRSLVATSELAATGKGGG